MMTDVLLGVILAFTVVAFSLLYATLNDIQLALTRIELVQHAIADELDLEPQDDIQLQGE